MNVLTIIKDLSVFRSAASLCLNAPSAVSLSSSMFISKARACVPLLCNSKTKHAVANVRSNTDPDFMMNECVRCVCVCLGEGVKRTGNFPALSLPVVFLRILFF